MPRLEPKDIQKELAAGELWPFYWIFGEERMKSRELMKKIQTLALGADYQNSFGLSVLEASETNAHGIVDTVMSSGLGGGLRFVIVRDAHLLKDPEPLLALVGPKAKKEKIVSVCVCLAKDLDGRKKFSKKIVEQGAVVSCESVPEADRDVWIDYLAKRSGVPLNAEARATLRSLDPWSLDIIDQELTKMSIALNPEDAFQLLCGQGSEQSSAEQFVDLFFKRNRVMTLAAVKSLSASPEDSLPLLGLLAWNTRMLAAYLVKPSQKSSFLAQRFASWSRVWSLDEVIALQHGLAKIDFEMKQTQRPVLASWVSVLTKFV